MRITERQTIDKLAERWGGYIVFSRSPNEKWKDWFQWNIQSLKAKRFLEDILPYLMLKREKAELAVRFQQHLIDSSPLRFKGQGMKRLPLDETLQIRDAFFKR